MMDAGSCTTLEHVNVPPAQTWNYLKINEATLRMPTPPAKGEVTSRLPRLFCAVEDGIGEAATRWVEDSAGDARYIEVPRHTRREEPILVEVDADEGQVADTGVLVREGAEATVALVSHATGDGRTHSANLVRIICERGARLTVNEVVALGNTHTHLEGLGIQVGEDATVTLRQYALGGHQVALGMAVDLVGDRSRLELETRYFANGEELLDVNHVVRQRGRDTRADLHAHGLLDDAAQKTLRETIDLVHGASRSKGNESETVLVVGEGVTNKTLPVILCDEDDVQGNHGASIGSVGADQLAYLAARGLSEEAAFALFARAVFDDAMIHAAVSEARAAALARATEVLGADVARDLSEALELGQDSPAERDDATC
ncbi:SufD family Fe-S cluster assembly protein [Olsenella massiliensis]|uniref:SufD family Fe-S cluster assembly protein n=1 Tax=Olsenella massiliensis TaxID=1622075 RepID=UPI00071C205D|nr:SufD family Fe-S cluster assembly protein [Olsenella massiliensis]